nr:protein ALP1-like [Tanacetum cinerariifolium]
AGANNDINVLNNFSLFDDLLDDLAHAVPCVVNGVEYRNGYYLADGIYPEWASFVKSFTVATDPKHTYFKQRQESVRKDVERAFGVLQGRWGLIQQPARAYEVNTRRIMYVGIIMHNMILEDQNMSIVDLNHVYSNPASKASDYPLESQRRNLASRDLDRALSESDADLVENAKTSFLQRYGNKKFQYDRVWNIWKNYPKWNAAEPIDKDNLQELFGPDPREHPAGKQRAPKKKKSVDTSSVGGNTRGSIGRSQSESVSGVLSQDYRSRCDAVEKPRSKFGKFFKNKESVEEVAVSDGEALGVDEDKSNKVISVLKDEGGEFVDSLDVINFGLSKEFVIKVLEGRDVFGESLVVCLKWVYHENVDSER